MLTENTVNKLQEMKLTAMARAFKEQLNDPNINGLAFEDRFGLLVDQEWTSRKNNHLKRLIKQAKFSETGACVEDIEYHSDRNLDSAQITRLASCNYIAERHNILLLGATGSGKTYLACALGMAAVRNFLSVRYVKVTPPRMQNITTATKIRVVIPDTVLHLLPHFHWIQKTPRRGAEHCRRLPADPRSNPYGSARGFRAVYLV